MLIELRDKDEKRPQVIKSQKTRILLKWLLEFRFSTFDVLSTVLESNTVNLNRFFNSLIDDGLIQVMTNVHTGARVRFVMLTKSGVDYLSNVGVDTTNVRVRHSDFKRYSKVAHDIGVQRFVAGQVKNLIQVIWDKNIVVAEGEERPDALIQHKNERWAAVQYERWSKESSRIYHLLYQHAKAREAKKYNGVIFVFDNSADLSTYQKAFDNREWPVYKRDYKKGHMTKLGVTYTPDENSDIRKSFIFHVLPTNYL